MSENIPSASRELPPEPPPIFGDIIVARDFNHGLPTLVIEVVPAAEVLHALDISREAEGEFGSLGTLKFDAVESTVGHKNFEDVLDIATKALCGPNATSADRTRIYEYLCRQFNQDKTETETPNRGI